MSNLKSALERALPIVAAAYGDQFGVNVVLSGNDACTNGKEIILPLLSNMSDLKDVLFGYLAHEASHCRDTDFDMLNQCQSPVERHLLNIIEDVRIERLIQEVFPGTQFTLNAMWTYIVDEGMSPPALPEQNEASQLCQYLLHRFAAEILKREVSNSFVKTSMHVVETTFPLGFFIRLDGLVGKYMDQLTCTSDSLILARAILNAVEETEQEESKRNEQGHQPAGGDQSNDSQGSNAGDSSSNEQGQQPTSGDQSNDSQNSNAGDSSSNGNSLSKTLSNEKDLPMVPIDQLRGRMKEQARSDNGHQSITIDATSAGEAVSNQGDTKELTTGILASSALRSRLTGLLQAQAREKHFLHTRGKRINGSRLARSTTGDLRVFVRREEKQQPNTAVHVLLDTSSSMGSIQEIANQATVSLALAISSIPKCDIAVSMFPGIDGKVSPMIKRAIPVRPSLGRLAVGSSGGTPLAEAMLYAARELATSKRERKVLIVITDGKPNNIESVHYMNDLIVDHVDTYAIGIKSNAVKEIFGNWTVINDVKELQSALFTIAGKFLEVA